MWARSQVPSGADTERARLLPAADRDVLLRGHRAWHAAPRAHRTDRAPRRGGPRWKPHRHSARRRPGPAGPVDGREVRGAQQRGAVLVDIRPAAQRAAEGAVPEAVVIERNVLEWRCDPTSDARLSAGHRDDVEWVILCSEGYTSSLAAAALQDLGLRRATDVVGGYHALVAEGVLGLLPGRSASSGAAPPSSPASSPRLQHRGPAVDGIFDVNVAMTVGYVDRDRHIGGHLQECHHRNPVHPR